jgi:hypothetical protein
MFVTGEEASPSKGEEASSPVRNLYIEKALVESGKGEDTL